MVGKIINQLQQKNLLQNTLIVFTSDNGYFQGEHRMGNKQFPYEESIRVPLIVRPPGSALTSNIANTNTIVNIDHAATILDYANLWNATYQSKIDGRSYKSMLDTPTVFRDSWRKMFLIEYHFARGLNYTGHSICWWCLPDFYALRTGTEALLNEGKNHLFSEFVDDPTRSEEPVSYELFNMIQDPNQISNETNNPSYAAKRAFYVSRLAVLKTCISDMCRKIENSILGDMNDDLDVNGQDIRIVLSNFSPGSDISDVSADSKTNTMDVGILFQNF
jgi:N-acetylglucosamine-6-sulfatase